MLCVWISILLLCLKHRYCFKFGGRKKYFIGVVTIFCLRALRREGICVFESFEKKMYLYLRALWGECAAASCWPGRINSFPWGGGKGENADHTDVSRCWFADCWIILRCQLQWYYARAANAEFADFQMLQLICGLLQLMQAHVEV